MNWKWKPKCPRCGKKLPTLHMPSNYKQWIVGGWTCKKCKCEVDCFGRERETEIINKPKPKKDAKNGDDEKPQELTLEVTLSPICDRVPVSEEEVNVPPGVCITVKRTRKVEHEVRMDNSVSMEFGHEGSTNLVGLLDVKYSIEREIQKQRGTTDKEEETMEYEVQLQGESNQPSLYVLMWSERWRTGEAMIQNGKGSIIRVPIRFKEAAELEVRKKQTGCTDPEEKCCK